MDALHPYYLLCPLRCQCHRDLLWKFWNLIAGNQGAIVHILPSLHSWARIVLFSCALWRRSCSFAGRFECDICGRVYSHSTSLQLHKKLHEGRTTCYLCGSAYGRVSVLRKHLQRVHHMSRADANAMAALEGRPPLPDELLAVPKAYSQSRYWLIFAVKWRKVRLWDHRESVQRVPWDIVRVQATSAETKHQTPDFWCRSTTIILEQLLSQCNIPRVNRVNRGVRVRQTERDVVVLSIKYSQPKMPRRRYFVSRSVFASVWYSVEGHPVSTLTDHLWVLPRRLELIKSLCSSIVGR